MKKKKLTLENRAKLDRQFLTCHSIAACIESIRSNTLDIGVALTPEQYTELSRISNDSYKLQAWIVFGDTGIETGAARRIAGRT